jgi:hypothetical protein
MLSVQVVVATNKLVRSRLRHFGEEFSPSVTMLEACNRRGLSLRFLGDDKLKNCHRKRGDVCGLILLPMEQDG